MTDTPTPPAGDDLLKRLEFCANLHPKFGHPENGKMFGEALARIKALEVQLSTARADGYAQGVRDATDRAEEYALDRGLRGIRAHTLAIQDQPAPPSPDAYIKAALEWAAKITSSHADDRPRRYSMDWNDGYMDGCSAASNAVRAAASDPATLAAIEERARDDKP